jgi:multiphosphoryl transfer protein
MRVEEQGQAPDAERRRLDGPVDAARLQLHSLQAHFQAQADPAKAAIFAAHQGLLDDPEILGIATSAIAKGKSAAFAWQRS